MNAARVPVPPPPGSRSDRPQAPPFVLDLSLAELEALLVSWGEPRFRARQIYRQLYVQVAPAPAAMTDLPRELRERLARDLAWEGMTPTRTVSGDQGQTRKALFVTPAGHPAEAVLMVYPDRATVCVSSQSGCRMHCAFCATGRMGFRADLSTGQIVAQALWAERELRARRPPSAPVPATPRRLSNVVFMGMGEPFDNFEAWWAAVERLHDPRGFNMGARAFTVSTVGLAPGIRRLAQAPLPVNLAISLHAPNDALRGELAPISRACPLADLFAAIRDYLTATGRRVSFEYVLLDGRNDRSEQAEELARLLRAQLPAGEAPRVHVNLIAWNSVPGTDLSRSRRERVRAFQRALETRGVPCTVRVERGTRIGAACGQLAGA